MVSKNQEEQILKETKALVKLFITTNASDIELSKMTGISSSTVGRRLTNEKRILTAFPDNGEKVYAVITSKRKSNLKQGKLLGGQISMLNNANVSSLEKLPKLKLAALSKSKDKQIRILIHMVLTFRVKLKLLSRLFQFEEQELLNDIHNVSNDSINKALDYLFNYDEFNQEIALANLIDFYSRFIMARQRKDKNAQKRLINEIDDYKVKLVLKNLASMDKIDFKSFLDYQFKYGLTLEETAKTLKIDSNIYENKIKEILAERKELKTRYELLEKFNANKELIKE